ncbi:MAG: sigma 54-interacting transcriptional regulator, partial [Planctomycetota bacterium]
MSLLQEGLHMIHLLFLDKSNALRSQMAEGFARARMPEGVSVASAGYSVADSVHPLAVEVMAEIGIDISRQTPKSFSYLSPQELDVVICMCQSSARECSMLLPGQPPQVNWDLPDPRDVSGDHDSLRASFRRVRDMIRRLVEDLFDRGYLQALTSSHRKAHLILDSLSEGIIAHDLKRRIFYFSGAAEAITGYSRHEILGRDCYDVFPGGLCGGKCNFSEPESSVPRFETIRYPLQIHTKSGELRDIDMTVRSILTEDREMAGVLASFRDLTREHDMALRLGKIESFAGIIGRDKKMLEIFELIRTVADSSVPILIQGKSGTGKELVAAAIHNESRRAKKLFVPVNCGALPEGLLESELFGHVRGAFTGAIHDKKGRFELADGGTIFLDEV